MNNSIGMLRAIGSPGPKAKAMAYISQIRGLKFYYFTLNDIDIGNKKVKAYTLINDQWVRQQVDYPYVIDNDVRSLKNKVIINELSQYCYLTTQILGGKLKTTQLIESLPQYKDIIIPYEMIKNEAQLRTFILNNKYVVIKPVGGNQGKNIQFILWEDRRYKINDGGNIHYFSEEDFSSFYEDKIKGRNIICQKYISSLTTHNQAFDLRVHVQRNGKREWEVTKIYARISAGEALVANLSAGGSMADGKLFLKHHFPEKYLNIYKKIQDIGLNLPRDFQKFYAKEIDSLGIDLGIDETGHVWLFEINSFPGSKYFEFERALTRINYLKTILNTRNNISYIKEKLVGDCKLIIDNTPLKSNHNIVFLKNKYSKVGMGLSSIRKNIEKIKIVLYAGDPIQDENLLQQTNFIRINDVDKFLIELAHAFRQEFSGKIYTVTGSVGKTSVSTLLAQMIKSLDSDTLINLKGNTPFYIANGMTQINNQNHAVFEVAGAGTINDEPIGAISHQILRPHICLFTTLAPAHIEKIGSMKAIAERKAAAFKYLPEGSVLVINKDVEYFEYMMSFVPDHVRVYTYAMNSDADAKIIEHNEDGMIIQIDQVKEKINVNEQAPELRLNYLGIIAVLKILFPDRWKESLFKLNAVKKVHGRGKVLNTVFNHKNITVIDESYNANPSSMKLAITNFNRLNTNKKIVVISEMLELGDFSLGYHREIVDLINTLDFDKVVLLGEIFKKLEIINDKVVNAENFENLNHILGSVVEDGSSILFKGSNSTGLNQYVKDNFYFSKN